MSKRRTAEATATVEPLADQEAETTTLDVPGGDEGQNEPSAPPRDSRPLLARTQNRTTALSSADR